MIPLRSYLLRAVYDWSLDNGYTPHLLVDALQEHVNVPPSFVQEGKITLNVHPDAVKDLQLGQDRVSFSARFGGQPQWVEVPMAAVLAVYARENGRGIVFQDEAPEPPPPSDKPAAPKRPALKRIK